MPEELTEEEQWALDVDNAKHEIRKRLVELGGLIGQEDARQFVEGVYPFTAF